jgi:hypothetical protein
MCSALAVFQATCPSIKIGTAVRQKPHQKRRRSEPTARLDTFRPRVWVLHELLPDVLANHKLVCNPHDTCLPMHPADLLGISRSFFGFQWTVSAWNLQSGALLKDALQPANAHKYDIPKYEGCVKELASAKE